MVIYPVLASFRYCPTAHLYRNDTSEHDVSSGYSPENGRNMIITFRLQQFLITILVDVTNPNGNETGFLCSDTIILGVI